MSTYPWSGQGAKLTDYDIPRIGHRIGVGEDVVHALLDVESRGKGFTKIGVICLFESHVFYRQLPQHKRAEALQMGLAHKTWRQAKAAGNYKNNYARLVQAYLFDAKAALESTSWGLGQIMGFNHELAGYTSAKEMVEDFAKSEAKQLEGMIEFIISAGLDDELRNRNWAGFARGYNGSGYKANRYDTREETKQSSIPAIAGGGMGVSVIAVSGMPLWAQFLLGAIVLVLTSYIVYRNLGDE